MDNAFKDVPPTTLADLLGRAQVMDTGIRPLWNSPRVSQAPRTPCGASPATT